MPETLTSVEDAQKDLPALLARAAAGEQVIISQAGKPVARLVAVEAAPRVPGRLKGQIWISDDFDEPLPDEIQRAFEGRGD